MSESPSTAAISSPDSETQTIRIDFRDGLPDGLRFAEAHVAGFDIDRPFPALIGVSFHNESGWIGYGQLDTGKLWFNTQLPPGFEAYAERSDEQRRLCTGLLRIIKIALTYGPET